MVHFSPRLGRRDEARTASKSVGGLRSARSTASSVSAQLARRQRADREPRAREQTGEVGAQLREGPRDRVEAVLERRDLVASIGVEMPVTTLREAVEAQPLATAFVAHAQRGPAVGTRIAVLDGEAQRSDGEVSHGGAV